MWIVDVVEDKRTNLFNNCTSMISDKIQDVRAATRQVVYSNNSMDFNKFQVHQISL